MRSRPISEETTVLGTPERSAGNDHATESLQEGLEQFHLTPPTSSASILSRPSSAGSEDRASPSGTDKDALNEPYYDPAFQSAIKYAADTARNIAEVLEDCPRSEPTIATLKQEARSLSSYRSPPSRVVGLIGQSGQGKSSLINSLLDVAELAVTGESGNAVTAFVIEYKYKQESQTSRFHIEASCLQSEEIDEQLEELLRQYLHPFIHSCQDLSTEEYQAVVERSEIAECIIDAAFSSFEGFSLESFKKQDKLRGLDAYGAILGLIQMTVLWIGSTSILMLFFFYPNQIHVDRGENEAPFAIKSTTLTERRRYPRTILSLCIMHTCIWMLPIMAISIPRPRMELTVWPNTLFIGLCDFLLIPACIVLVTCMFPLQIREIISLKRPIHESSLSPATLALQMIAFILLGLSWRNRVGRPGDPFNITPPDLTQPRALYRLGAWQWVNNMIFGVGQGLLLLICLWVRSQQWTLRGRTQGVDETTALL